MRRSLYENHWGSPTLILLNVLGVLGVLNVLYVLHVLNMGPVQQQRVALICIDPSLILSLLLLHS